MDSNVSTTASPSLFSNLKYDLPASIVVFLVALPAASALRLLLALRFSGIIAGIVGGIVVGFASGSQIGVSSTAVVLPAVIVLSAIQEFGTFEVFLLVVNGLRCDTNVVRFCKKPALSDIIFRLL